MTFVSSLIVGFPFFSDVANDFLLISLFLSSSSSLVGRNSFFLVFFVSDCLILGLRVVDRIFDKEGFGLFGSSVVRLSATKEEVEG